MTYQNKGREVCLGYLMHFPGHGVYDPTWGRIDVTPQEAEAHNRLLSEAEIRGLDESCQVGQGGVFYIRLKDGKVQVITWIGTIVSTEADRRGPVVTFRRRGKTFRGRTVPETDLLRFRRTA